MSTDRGRFKKRDTSQITQIANNPEVADNIHLSKVASQVYKKPQSKRAKLIKSFKEINLQVFVELGRIKKPSKHAFIAGKMICLIVNIMREKPILDEFDNWPAIQAFINHNVNKFT